MSTLEILLRGLAAGMLLATAAGMTRSQKLVTANWTGALFALSAAAFAVHSGGAETDALRPLLPLIWLLAAAGVGYFWLFGISLFEDSEFRLSRIIPIAVLTGLSAIGSSLPPDRAAGVWIIHNLIEVSLVAHLLFIISRSWSGDLVETRRRLRAPFLVAVGLYCVVLSGFEIAEELELRASWFGIAQAATLAAISLAGIVVFTQADPNLFGTTNVARQADPLSSDVKDRPLVAKLETIMADEAVWRREGLTIGQLAEKVGVPEHRLRRVINDSLGYRNFADFLNARRVAAAKATLSEPMKADVAISTIAFDLGYASLGPFNRAFKAATGMTPTAFRAQALAVSKNP
jgi:AraC-like DNA-binding protein